MQILKCAFKQQLTHIRGWHKHELPLSTSAAPPDKDVANIMEESGSFMCFP